jgi:hypothetical protein
MYMANGDRRALYDSREHCSFHIVLCIVTREESPSQQHFPLSSFSGVSRPLRDEPKHFNSVAVQNERYEDWSPRPGVKIPKAVNSSVSQGNFLETLNISLNGE